MHWLRRIARYGVIGGCATLVHALILFGLVEQAILSPPFATVIGFLGAVNISYFGHYYITFASAEPHRRALPSFISLTLTGACLNWLIFAIISDALGWHYWIAFLASFFTVPAVSFILLGRWAFQPKD